jgi:transposase-like protein
MTTGLRSPLGESSVAGQRGIEISHQTVRYWLNRFGPLFSAEIRSKRVEGTLRGN